MSEPFFKINWGWFWKGVIIGVLLLPFDFLLSIKLGTLPTAAFLLFAVAMLIAKGIAPLKDYALPLATMSFGVAMLTMAVLAYHFVVKLLG